MARGTFSPSGRWLVERLALVVLDDIGDELLGMQVGPTVGARLPRTLGVMRKPLPTDREILKCIFEMYESQYPGVQSGAARGENDPHLAIDIRAVADSLGCNAELLFGRLYYHLDHKYRYKQDGGALVPLFYLKVGDKRHAVHFPYLVAILAEHQQEYRNRMWSLAVSVLALVLSVASLAVNFYKR